MCQWWIAELQEVRLTFHKYISESKKIQYVYFLLFSYNYSFLWTYLYNKYIQDFKEFLRYEGVGKEQWVPLNRQNSIATNWRYIVIYIFVLLIPFSFYVNKGWSKLISAIYFRCIKPITRFKTAILCSQVKAREQRQPKLIIIVSFHIYRKKN